MSYRGEPPGDRPKPNPPPPPPPRLHPGEIVMGYTHTNPRPPEARAELDRLWAERGPPEGKIEPPKKVEDSVPW